MSLNQQFQKAKVEKVGKIVADDDAPARPRMIGGTLAQMMLLLAGILLSVSAYIGLGLYTKTTLGDEQRALTRAAQEVVVERLAQPASSIDMISSVLSFVPDNEKLSLAGNDPRLTFAAGSFDRLFLIIKDPVGSWYVRDITPGASVATVSPIAAGSENAFKDKVIGAVTTNSRVSTVITDIPGAFYTAEQTMPLIKVRPVAYARALIPGQPERGIVTGLVRLSGLIGRNWVEGQKDIDSLFIRDAQSGQPVYVISRSLSESRADAIAQKGHDGVVYNGSGRWQVAVVTGGDAKSVMFAQIPNIALILGLILTVLLTAYVRAVQKGAQHVAAVRKQLAQKAQTLTLEISERDRLKGLLRRREQEMKIVVDIIDDLIFEISAEAKILSMSPGWLHLTGEEVKTVVGRELFSLIFPADQKTQRDVFRHLRESKGISHRFDTRIRTADGGYRAVEIQFMLLKSPAIGEAAYVGRIRDLEMHSRTEKALSDVENRYRDIVENAVSGIYQVSAEGHFASVNPAMARMLGYSSPAQMMGEVTNAHKALYENMRERSRFIREVIENGEVRNYETQMITRSGSRIWINENARAVRDDKDNVLYIEGSIDDITRIKEVEGQLRDAKVRSDMATRAKSEFLANMSHELRTPLNSIIGFAEIIKKEVLGPLNNAQYRDYAGDIYESGRKLMTIINEILDISKIEAGQRPLNEMEINLASLSGFCVDFLSSRAEEGKLKLINNIDERAPRLRGEELALKQIFLNLLSNAIKYTPEGGQITLGCELDQDRQLRISVTDTGIGLNEEEIEKALSAFGQVETALNRSGSGVGLGLTLVDLLVKLHGGKLEIFSQKGVGTTVTVILPASRVLSRVTGASAADDRAPGPKTLQ